MGLTYKYPTSQLSSITGSPGTQNSTSVNSSTAARVPQQSDSTGLSQAGSSTQLNTALSSSLSRCQLSLDHKTSLLRDSVPCQSRRHCIRSPTSAVSLSHALDRRPFHQDCRLHSSAISYRKAPFARPTETELSSPQSTAGNSGSDYILFTLMSDTAN
jgi:hypothetical protein